VRGETPVAVLRDAMAEFSASELNERDEQIAGLRSEIVPS
jgi:hypothetical protein